MAKQETQGCLWRRDRVMGSQRTCHVAILALCGLGWCYPALNWLLCEMGAQHPISRTGGGNKNVSSPVSPFSEQSPVWLPAALTQLTGSFCKFPPSQQELGLSSSSFAEMLFHQFPGLTRGRFSCFIRGCLSPSCRASPLPAGGASPANWQSLCPQPSPS